MFPEEYLITIVSKDIHSQNFLLSLSTDAVEKFDLYANKNSKYLFYKFNDQIYASGGERQIIRHIAKVKHEVGMKKNSRKRQAVSS